MYRLAICVALCSLSSALPLSYHGGAAAGLNSPFNAVNPYAAGRYTAGAGYNSPYYNPASATAPILSYSNEKGPDGSYSFSFATGDGKQAQETGFLKNAFVDHAGSPQGTQVVEGSYSYTTPEGTPIHVNYVADENGFRTSGDHISANANGVLPGGVLGAAGYGGQLYNQGYNGYSPYNYGNNYNRNPYVHGNNYNLRNPHSGVYNRIGH